MNYCGFNILKPKQFIWSSCDWRAVTWGHLYTFSQAVYVLEQQTLKKKKRFRAIKRGILLERFLHHGKRLSGTFLVVSLHFSKAQESFTMCHPGMSTHSTFTFTHPKIFLSCMLQKKKKLQPFLHLKSIDYSTLFTATDFNASYFKAQPFCALYLNHLWHMDKCRNNEFHH